MTIEFNCPHCDKSLKTSDDRAGRDAKCPGCGELISVPVPTEGAILDAEEVLTGFDSGETDSESEAPDVRKPCPACGEAIVAAAIRCRFCGEVFSSSRGGRGRNGIRREMRPFPPGEVISDAWRIYSERMGLSILAFVVLFVLSIVSNIVFGVSIGISQEQYDQGNTSGAIIGFCVTAVLGVLAIAFFSYLQAGYLTLQIKIVREEDTSLGDLFSGGRFTFRMFLNSVLFGLMCALGYCACIIPGLLLALMFFFYGHVLVDDDLPGIQSLSRAKQLSDGNWGSLILIFNVGMACAFAGLLACYIGMIFTIPFVSILWAVAYDRMTCQTQIDDVEPA